MTMHFWLGRALFVLALVLFGLSGTARADHFLTHPAASVGVATLATVVKPRTIDFDEIVRNLGAYQFRRGRFSWNGHSSGR